MKKLDKRRRREGKTDYHKRLTLLKSGIPRLVVRKTNKYIILQIVESSRSQDRVLITVSTKDLLKNGWPADKVGSLKSLSAAYLGGYLIGKKVKDLKKVILDSGLIPSTKGSRVYAAVKGVADSGLEIPHSEDILPSEEMTKKYEFFDSLKNKIGGGE